MAAALAVTTAGPNTRVDARCGEVRSHFHGDFQGLENWIDKTDVLDEMISLGITTDFEQTPFYEVPSFNPDGVPHRFRSKGLLFYLLHRGSEDGSLELALKRQATAAGVELRFKETASHLADGRVVTEGPHRAGVIAAGYLFETKMADGAYASVSDLLAPKGNSYLLVHVGMGTLVACPFNDFHNEHRYVERTLEFFKNKLGLCMQNSRRCGGTGNFSLPRSALGHKTPLQVLHA